MRGKVYGKDYQLGDKGITPAYAGKRPCQILAHRLRRDHPRLCGEKQQHV